MGTFSDTLVLQAMQGDALALEGLLRRTQPDLRRYARRFCLAADVDDAVQESLIRITQRLPQLRAAAALSGWLMTMVRRECLRLARRVWREEPSDEELLAQLATRAEDGLRLDLARALESLPAHHLEIVLLRDFEELSLQDIAQRTGESLACVKSRLHRARTLVREYLATAS